MIIPAPGGNASAKSAGRTGRRRAVFGPWAAAAGLIVQKRADCPKDWTL